MDFIFLILSGWMIGLIAAVPIGPVNLICIRRTLQCGWRYGFVSGLGAALGDMLFACVIGFSLTAVRQLIQGHSLALQIIGGLLLVAIGVRMYNAPPPERINEALGPYAQKNAQNCAKMNGNGAGKNGSRTRGMASTFALTMTNPATLAWFMGWFSSMGGLADNPSFFSAAEVVGGVFLGSATWWLTLTAFVGKLHAQINDRVVRVINRVSGVLVFLSGIGLLVYIAYDQLFR